MALVSADIPFSMLALFISIDMSVGVIGLVLGMKGVNGSPLITVFAGILMFALIALTTNIDVGYSDAQPSNSTQNGGVLTCATTTNTVCTPSAITKSFSYFNSTGQLTNKPNPIPIAYSVNQENIWVFFLILGIMWCFVGIIIQVKLLD